VDPCNGNSCSRAMSYYEISFDYASCARQRFSIESEQLLNNAVKVKIKNSMAYDCAGPTITRKYKLQVNLLPNVLIYLANPLSVQRPW